MKSNLEQMSWFSCGTERRSGVRSLETEGAWSSGEPKRPTEAKNSQQLGGQASKGSWILFQEGIFKQENGMVF